MHIMKVNIVKPQVGLTDVLVDTELAECSQLIKDVLLSPKLQQPYDIAITQVVKLTYLEVSKIRAYKITA